MIFGAWHTLFTNQTAFESQYLSETLSHIMSVPVLVESLSHLLPYTHGTSFQELLTEFEAVVFSDHMQRRLLLTRLVKVACIINRAELQHIIRPFINYGVSQSRSILDRALAVNYKLMSSLDRQPKKRLALMAAGFIASQLLAERIDGSIVSYFA